MGKNKIHISSGNDAIDQPSQSVEERSASGAIDAEALDQNEQLESVDPAVPVADSNAAQKMEDSQDDEFPELNRLEALLTLLEKNGVSSQKPVWQWWQWVGVVCLIWIGIVQGFYFYYNILPKPVPTQTTVSESAQVVPNAADSTQAEIETKVKASVDATMAAQPDPTAPPAGMPTYATFADWLNVNKTSIKISIVDGTQEIPPVLNAYIIKYTEDDFKSKASILEKKGLVLKLDFSIHNPEEIGGDFGCIKVTVNGQPIDSSCALVSKDGSLADIDLSKMLDQPTYDPAFKYYKKANYKQVNSLNFSWVAQPDDTNPIELNQDKTLITNLVSINQGIETPKGSYLEHEVILILGPWTGGTSLKVFDLRLEENRIEIKDKQKLDTTIELLAWIFQDLSLPVTLTPTK